MYQLGSPKRLWQLPGTKTLHVNVRQADTWPGLPEVARQNGTIAAIVGHTAIRANSKAKFLQCRIAAELAPPPILLGGAVLGIAQEAAVGAVIAYGAVVHTGKRVLALDALKHEIEYNAVLSATYQQHAQDIRFPVR